MNNQIIIKYLSNQGFLFQWFCPSLLPIAPMFVFSCKTLTFQKEINQAMNKFLKFQYQIQNHIIYLFSCDSSVSLTTTICMGFNVYIQFSTISCWLGEEKPIVTTLTKYDLLKVSHITWKNKPSFCSDSCDEIHATIKLQKLHWNILDNSWNFIWNFLGTHLTPLKLP